ncbi:MAG: glycosyltransferase [Candidatus Binatus sp.]|uniref:glycosyltransferase n=1 Tax=Candidatus Binatus sp. TaxID=2811406 RepID=UPI0027253158|nr:glycosyltransferase [Candidatus Binatus sp.]MDO8435049.1 glycosyltransferase [Candidatus Binatus sp.]
MKLRVLHLITNLTTGGAEMILLKLLQHQDREKFESEVVSLRELGTIGPRIKELGVPVTALGLSSNPTSIVALWQLLKICRAGKFDVIQTWMYHANLAGLVALAADRRARLCWSVHAAGLDFNPYPMSFKLIFRLLAALSSVPSATVVCSDASRLWHEHFGYSPSRWKYIPTGGDLEAFSPDCGARERIRRELEINQSDPVIGLVSRDNPMKDHPNFLRAFAQLKSRMPSLCGVLAGAGLTPDNERLTGLAGKLGILDSIQLLGERHDVADLMNSFDLFCLPSSDGESCPNVLIEAMSCGVPCVATDVGDSGFIIGNSGAIVPPRDSDALAQACAKLLSLDAEGRRALGCAARQRVIERFSLPAVVNAYEQLYLELANDRR